MAKKVLSVFLAMLMIFSVCSIAVSAEDDDTAGSTEWSIEITTKNDEEDTTRNIVNEDGLVVPLNGIQLKFSIVFKIFEKILNFIMGLFNDGGETEQNAADAVDDAGQEIRDWVKDLLG